MLPSRPVVALVALLLAVVLAGCGVRLDTPPPEVPAAGPEEELRQQAALDAAEIYQAAAAARTDPAARGEDGAELLGALVAVESTASAHHHALGGVWEPWPGAGPDATAHPSGEGAASPTPPASASPRDVIRLLEDSAAEARATALADTGDLGRLLGSVAISQTFLAADVAAALSISAERLPAAPLPEPAPGDVDPDTSRVVDGARYALEVVAARSSGSERDTARQRAEQLSAIAGAVAPEHDTREVAYDLSGVVAGEGTAPERAIAGAAELDVVGAHLLLLAGDWPDRDSALAAATYAAGQARAWGVALPALPGLT